MEAKREKDQYSQAGLIVLIFSALLVFSVSTAHAQLTFAQQLEAAAAELDPEARAEFEELIKDPESMDAILVDMGVPAEVSAHLMQYASGARTNAPEIENEHSNRKSYIERVTKRLKKYDDKINSKTGDKLVRDKFDKLDKDARKAAKAAEKAAKKAAKDAEKAAKDADKDKDKGDDLPGGGGGGGGDKDKDKDKKK